MNYKIQTLNNISKKGLKILSDNYTVLDQPENPDAILLRSFKMHDMDLPASVKFVGRAGAGVNNIPLDKCSEKGIVVCNSPGANANAVKELVIAGMLISSRKVVDGIEWSNTLVDKGDEVPALVEKGKSAFSGPELYGKKIGVIGLGAIGVLVANMAVDLGMKVYGFDPFISINNAWGLSRKVRRAASKEQIFKNCDYISLHIPFMEETKDYVNANLLKDTKEGLRLLNFARGGLVNYDALENAIEEGIVASYVTDFPNERLLKMKNVINIPHLGASTPESEENCAEMVIHSLKEYLENGNIINSVNYPDCDMGICESANRITVNHANVPNMLGQITKILADNDINISIMTNKNRGAWAYTMIDVDCNVGEDVKTALKGIKGVTRVRIIK
ncbi:phosphoglycerate dehydrogenase [Acetobacterium woodii]|uniref:D-3-phosphoglycerate dehydrogenase n=1 Tax=Acetobacterium woodii (strain ATCC 29683 / DSM 1030 / JCM 2381 / KCTC 1655 / WB1) TaxID=931626 RepID=H6LG92_ACEWD|nr:phosphoglycerate dehydrogenase [Acetobacterium woodii]AFA49568.1 D-3-phosphoglycerate dehydrogenase SerA2 [Acetobacterium woodii DSM 1030]